MTEAERRERDKYLTEEDSISFNIIDEGTLEVLKKEEVALPYNPKVVNIPKDERWNMKQMTSKLMQGIMQGDSIPKISKSFMDVVGNNSVSATRTARTMVTQCENKGRLDSYKTLDMQGVVQEKVWIATPDSRTRASHLDVDSESVDVRDTFSNGLEYPADPNGDPAEVYNCRCSMRTEIIGFRRTDGSISYVGYVRDETMHYGQILNEKNRRNAEARQKIEKIFEQQQKKAEAEKKKAKSDKKLHGDIDAYNWLDKYAKNSNIQHKEVELLGKALTGDEIIKKLAGGDLTSGSCASLALAYCGNKAGFDVIDFRGGDSRSMFSRRMNSEKLYKTANAEIKEIIAQREAKDVAAAIRKIDEGREYVLHAGCHASVIRKNNGVLEYLELQSPYQNGWQKMEWKTERSERTVEQTLYDRFGCRKRIQKDSWTGQVKERRELLIPVDSIQGTEEFRGILGYLNTDPSKQKKGAGGYVK